MPRSGGNYEAAKNLTAEKIKFDKAMRDLLEWEKNNRAEQQGDSFFQLQSSKATVAANRKKAYAEFRGRGKNGNIYHEPSILEKEANSYGKAPHPDKAKLLQAVAKAREGVQAAAKEAEPLHVPKKDADRMFASNWLLAGGVVLGLITLGLMVIFPPVGLALPILGAMLGAAALGVSMGTAIKLSNLYRGDALFFKAAYNFKTSEDTSLDDLDIEKKAADAEVKALEAQHEEEVAADAQDPDNAPNRGMQRAREKVDEKMRALLALGTGSGEMHGKAFDDFQRRDKENDDLYHNPSALEKHSDRFTLFRSQKRQEEREAVRELKEARAELNNLAREGQPGAVSKSARNNALKWARRGLVAAVVLGAVAALTVTGILPAALAVAGAFLAIPAIATGITAGAVAFYAGVAAVAAAVFSGISYARTPNAAKVYDMNKKPVKLEKDKTEDEKSSNAKSAKTWGQRAGIAAAVLLGVAAVAVLSATGILPAAIAIAGVGAVGLSAGALIGTAVVAGFLAIAAAIAPTASRFFSAKKSPAGNPGEGVGNEVELAGGHRPPPPPRPPTRPSGAPTVLKVGVLAELLGEGEYGGLFRQSVGSDDEGSTTHKASKKTPSGAPLFQEDSDVAANAMFEDSTSSDGVWDGISPPTTPTTPPPPPPTNATIETSPLPSTSPEGSRALEDFGKHGSGESGGRETTKRKLDKTLKGDRNSFT